MDAFFVSVEELFDPSLKGSAGPEHPGARNRPEEGRKYMLEIDNSLARPSLNCGGRYRYGAEILTDYSQFSP
jgi:hypothetical protein